MVAEDLQNAPSGLKAEVEEVTTTLALHWNESTPTWRALIEYRLMDVQLERTPVKRGGAQRRNLYGN